MLQQGLGSLPRGQARGLCPPHPKELPRNVQTYLQKPGTERELLWPAGQGTPLVRRAGGERSPESQERPPEDPRQHPRRKASLLNEPWPPGSKPDRENPSLHQGPSPGEVKAGGGGEGNPGREKCSPGVVG